jgi:hypothetical protein
MIGSVHDTATDNAIGINELPSLGGLGDYPTGNRIGLQGVIKPRVADTVKGGGCHGCCLLMAAAEIKGHFATIPGIGVTEESVMAPSGCGALATGHAAKLPLYPVEGVPLDFSHLSGGELIATDTDSRVVEVVGDGDHGRCLLLLCVCVAVVGPSPKGDAKICWMAKQVKHFLRDICHTTTEWEVMSRDCGRLGGGKMLKVVAGWQNGNSPI